MSETSISDRRYTAVFLLGLVFCYLAPDLASRTLALDGLVYANVAKLFLMGEGSFWTLPFYTTDLPRFTDHPPLGVAVQSLWMSVVGTAWWADKAYAALLSVIWFVMVLQLAAKYPGEAPAWWLIVFLALLPPVTHTLKNGFLELPLSLSILAAVWCCGRAFEQRVWAVAAGLFTGVALLIKGPVGLFPFAAPGVFLFYYTWQWPRLKQALAIGTIMFVTCTVLLTVAGWPEDARSWLAFYLESQVLGSISGVRPAEHGRLYLLQHLLICGAILTTLTLLISRGRLRVNRRALMWLMMGLAYALPLLISERQYRHYLLPCLPFFALAAWSVLPAAGQVVETAVKKVWWLPAAAALAWITVAWGTPGQDAEELRDAAEVSAFTQSESVAFCEGSQSLKLSAYLHRHHNIKTSPPPRSWIVCQVQPAAGYQPRVRLSEGADLWHKPPGLPEGPGKTQNN